ncbi:hypothetical protein [Streptomyces lavendofoliae]|uniref:hypothetical protein n=1 Tax=Streptomyces lavendofoliae TaxID=67314 RepID=UPI003D8AFA0E
MALEYLPAGPPLRPAGAPPPRPAPGRRHLGPARFTRPAVELSVAYRLLSLLLSQLLPGRCAP